ncbi:response regulator [Leadbettera azotonutricia]|uniref:CheY-like protein n=1 Tax=Leadbettera azotonutricia (strain ATCC BAA-888 / DSM 13862 / ZAS-9) TaxID=545695 RepID=F5YFS3_LEAAZ|nr:response regulator [Leadbettera azotonutricia]AEF82980.1 CheY-like protein [Leadbettera azotonutricia ZAS-9]
MNVLVVDDSKFMRNIVKSYFSEIGMPCHYFEAVNGLEALKILQSTRMDLVLLDWNMPAMTGISFLKKVRAIESLKNLPIIMVTSEGAKANVIEAFKSGVSDYILKPIDGRIFKEKIKEIFG